MSKGENKIINILNKARIRFVREKSFSDLKNGLFRFDFYIQNLNGAPAIIEYNGEQHYHFVSKFFKTQRDWKKAQEHDRRKISYCLANDIPIYIIPFWDLDKITQASDIFQEKYRARTRWKNDDELPNSPLYKGKK